MKASLILTGLLLALAPGIFAQDQDFPRLERLAERMESQKVAFITNKLQLTPEESAAFWPVYNEYKAKEREKRESIKPGKRLTEMSDEEASAQLDEHLRIEREMIDLKEEYIDRFKEILSAKKVIQLEFIEQEFKMEMLQKIREHRGRGDGSPPGNRPRR